MDLLDPDVVGLEEYDVHEFIGSGTTSDVFRVTPKNEHHSYVLKQMSLQNMTDEEKLRARQEILVMNGINHPNVVKFRESFSGPKSVDIIMEYCGGGTLEQLIERQRYEGKPFPEDVIIEWMAELLCAFAHIHSHRILHRDIKTGNIFVTKKNHLKLGDLGVCTVLNNPDSKLNSMIGTPLYFAPEVCDNRGYDQRSDVWSLGVVFYEICTLRRPFEGNNLLSLICSILNDNVKPFNTGLNSSFEEIVLEMLSKDPLSRPTAQNLINLYLEVPASHPSHPSQKPSRSRLIQQYFGPQLHYEKPWPPPEGYTTPRDSFTREWITSCDDLLQYKELLRTATVVPNVATDQRESCARSKGTYRGRKGVMATRGKPLNEVSRGTSAGLLSGPEGHRLGRDRPREKDVSNAVTTSEESVSTEASHCLTTMPMHFSSQSDHRRSTSIRDSSSFLNDISAVIDRHSFNSGPIQLDELDDAVMLLSQYKSMTYGLY